MSCTTIASSGAAAKSSAVRAQIAGWVMASRSRRAALSPKTIRPQSGSVQNPVVRDHAGTESFADRGEGRHTGLDDFSGDPVGVDDDSAQTRQPCRDTGLPRPDPAGQSHAQHGCTLPVPTVTPGRGHCGSRPRVVPVTEPYAGCSPSGVGSPPGGGRGRGSPQRGIPDRRLSDTDGGRPQGWAARPGDRARPGVRGDPARTSPQLCPTVPSSVRRVAAADRDGSPGSSTRSTGR